MKTLADLMREGDPLTEDPAMSDGDAADIRRRVVSEAAGRSARRIEWGEALAIAAALAVMIGVGIASGRRPPRALAGGAADSNVGPPADRRQLQFATPGGTRIIWTFDSDFAVKETTP